MKYTEFIANAFMTIVLGSIAAAVMAAAAGFIMWLF